MSLSLPDDCETAGSVDESRRTAVSSFGCLGRTRFVVLETGIRGFSSEQCFDNRWQGLCVEIQLVMRTIVELINGLISKRPEVQVGLRIDGFISFTISSTG